MSIFFTKMQSLGNDFVILTDLNQSVNMTPQLVKHMGDRHFGIGFDQLLFIQAAPNATADFSYRIFNADGKEVGQCGNGARCIGRYLQDNAFIQKDNIILATKERNIEIHCRLEAEIVSVNMGSPLFEPETIPCIVQKRADTYILESDGKQVTVGVVNVGNPHAVLLVEEVIHAPVDFWGLRLQNHPMFPEQVNVGFMQCVDRQHIKLRVYERGVGETLACGSGACAAMVIGRKQGLLDEMVDVELPGGHLTVKWHGLDHPVWLEGPVETIFEGEWLI